MFPFVSFLYLKSHGIETDSFWRENTIKLKNLKIVCSKYDQKLFQSKNNGKKLDSPVTSPDEDCVMPLFQTLSFHFSYTFFHKFVSFC